MPSNKIRAAVMERGSEVIIQIIMPRPKNDVTLRIADDVPKRQAPPLGLSWRQEQVFAGLVAELSVREIANRLGIDRGTANGHAMAMVKKLGLPTLHAFRKIFVPRASFPVLNTQK